MVMIKENNEESEDKGFQVAMTITRPEDLTISCKHEGDEQLVHEHMGVLVISCTLILFASSISDKQKSYTVCGIKPTRFQQIHQSPIWDMCSCSSLSKKARQ